MLEKMAAELQFIYIYFQSTYSPKYENLGPLLVSFINFSVPSDFKMTPPLQS